MNPETIRLIKRNGHFRFKDKDIAKLRELELSLSNEAENQIEEQREALERRIEKMTAIPKKRERFAYNITAQDVERMSQDSGSGELTAQLILTAVFAYFWSFFISFYLGLGLTAIGGGLIYASWLRKSHKETQKHISTTAEENSLLIKRASEVEHLQERLNQLQLEDAVDKRFISLLHDRYNHVFLPPLESEAEQDEDHSGSIVSATPEGAPVPIPVNIEKK